ncbi:MAG: hypothetical protein KDD42_08540, partial [Bdellovibrionales bacterium]|nr:hypothetical protein [Bdellovibrionales bacterium]
MQAVLSKRIPHITPEDTAHRVEFYMPNREANADATSTQGDTLRIELAEEIKKHRQNDLVGTKVIRRAGVLMRRVATVFILSAAVSMGIFYAVYSSKFKPEQLSQLPEQEVSDLVSITAGEIAPSELQVRLPAIQPDIKKASLAEVPFEPAQPLLEIKERQYMFFA